MDALTGLAWILCSSPGAGSRASLPGHPNVCGGLGQKQERLVTGEGLAAAAELQE